MCMATFSMHLFLFCWGCGGVWWWWLFSGFAHAADPFLRKNMRARWMPGICGVAAFALGGACPEHHILVPWGTILAPFGCPGTPFWDPMASFWWPEDSHGPPMGHLGVHTWIFYDFLWILGSPGDPCWTHFSDFFVNWITK